MRGQGCESEGEGKGEGEGEGKGEGKGKGEGEGEGLVFILAGVVCVVWGFLCTRRRRVPIFYCNL